MASTDQQDLAESPEKLRKHLEDLKDQGLLPGDQYDLLVRELNDVQEQAARVSARRAGGGQGRKKLSELEKLKAALEPYDAEGALKAKGRYRSTIEIVNEDADWREVFRQMLAKCGGVTVTDDVAELELDPSFATVFMSAYNSDRAAETARERGYAVTRGGDEDEQAPTATVEQEVEVEEEAEVEALHERIEASEAADEAEEDEDQDDDAFDTSAYAR
jgi:hypothetical protein